MIINLTFLCSYDRLIDKEYIFHIADTKEEHRPLMQLL